MSSRNAITHGLFTQDVVAAGEDEDMFNGFLAALTEEFQPEGVLEMLLVERIAKTFWREKRLAIAEKLMIEQEAQRANEQSDMGFNPDGRDVARELGRLGVLPIGKQLLIGRYQIMINGQNRQDIKDLREAQTLRLKTVDATPPEKISNDT